MTLAERIYRITHRKKIKNGGKIPYYWKYSITKIISKPIRKFFSAALIPIIPFNNIRIALYRLCGYKIGKKVFIGMRCYLDDMCRDKIFIGDNVTISYGVYFACHGRKQVHNTITIEDGAYIGMKANIVARTPLRIGVGAVVGACSLVNKDVESGITVAGIPAKQLLSNDVVGRDKWSNYKVYKHCLIWDGAPDKELQLTKRLARVLMKQHGAWMLRNCWNWDCRVETNFWDIIKTEYSPEVDYSKKVRKYIEKANTKFDIRLISKERMLNEGYEVLSSAHAGYRVKGTVMTPKSFRSMIENCTSYHDFWGCIDRETGKMEAYSIVRKNGSCVLFESSKANPAFLPKYYPMYGLYDARNKYYLTLNGVKYVDSGSRTITEHSNVQDFLIEKIGFRKAYYNMRIHYTSMMRWIVLFLYPFRNLKIMPKSVQNVLRLEEISKSCQYEKDVYT